MEKCTRCGANLPIGRDAYCPRCGKEFGIAEVTTKAPVQNGLVGEATKERFLAAWLDSLLAAAAGLAASAIFPPHRDLEKVITAVVVFLLYFWIFEGFLGATPGKFLFGLRVRNLNGERCSLRQAGIRTVARLVEVNPILLGAIPAGIAILVSQRKQRLGDYWANTVVISQETP